MFSRPMLHPLACCLLPVFLPLLQPASAIARTWQVAPGGGGDAPTIQAAIDSAASGDTLALADGTFRGAGNRDIEDHGKELTVRSGGGAPACAIDVEGSPSEPHRGFILHAGETTGFILEGVTVTGAWNGAEPSVGGGAVTCDGGWVTLRDCVLRGNHAGTGGALHVVSGRLDLERCVIDDNSAEYAGGALHAHAARVTVSGCLFRRNHALRSAIADCIYGGSLEARDVRFEDNMDTGATGFSGCVSLHGMVTGVFDACVFAGNSARAIVATSKVSHGLMTGCTLAGNRAGNYGVIFCGELDFVIERTLVAFNQGGPAIRLEGRLTIACSDLFGNQGGDWVGPLADELGQHGNISADPRFCDIADGAYTLDAASPCLPGQHPHGDDCGLIGALGRGCGATPTRAARWGSVKRELAHGP